MQRAFGTMVVALSMIALGWASGPARAYPITPEPLWPLTAKAELIVVAQVVEVARLAYDEEDWNSAIATLEVRETWKGDDPGRIEVPYPANLLCPAPPRYLEDETVVAFLAWDEEASAWSTVSLSYGTLYPRGEEMDDMRSMVRRAVELQKSDLSAKKMKRAKLEWLVQAAALPGTRWHGLYGLEPRGDRIRSFYDRGRKARKHRLTEDHQALLADAFLAHPRADHTSTMMLRVLRDHQDPLVDRLGLGMVEAGLELESTPHWLHGLMQEVLIRHGDPDPQARFDAVNERSWEITPEQLRGLWSKAKQQLTIAEVAPVELDIPEYLPVGGQTPD